ncbi:MAG: extracellular solute-binding protein [Thermoflexales bacterium]|nr:extracellular solute-binding protein [Thermoflexales bacterium]MDW8351216.1 extracellular solute-binding protein [Anaerolineae bacterium]
MSPFANRKFTRRQFLKASAVAGGAAALAACAAPPPSGAPPAPDAGATTAPAAPAVVSGERPLKPTFYQWIIDLHPHLTEINNTSPDVKAEIAPVEGFGIERFVAEAKNKESTWDVYVGMTPFVEMTQLIRAGVIEPWDNYIPKDVLDDIIPSIREECTVDGKLYSWPFLLDITGMGWHSGITDKAGVTDMPKTWDDVLAAAAAIVESKAAPYGVVYDPQGWRSLAPITHSLSTKVYTPEGRFDFTNEAAVEALVMMKKLKDFAPPNLLEPGATDGGVNGTPDEVAFAAEKTGFYFKYFNAPYRMAANWKDPKQLRIGPLPKFVNGEGSTVFWTTGACLFTYGKNKEKAAEYMKKITYDMQIWKDSIVGTPSGHPVQLPPYTSIYKSWAENRPDWLPEAVNTIYGQLPIAKAITNHLFGLKQFQIARPFYDKYLTGEEKDAKAVMQQCMDAVTEELKKAA